MGIDIQVNYQKAINTAKRLENLASKLERIRSNEIEAKNNVLRNKWKSESADKYFANVRELDEGIASFARDIRKTASNTRKIAEAFNIAEEKNKSIAGHGRR